jgi:hypothetical protein
LCFDVNRQVHHAEVSHRRDQRVAGTAPEQKRSCRDRSACEGSRRGQRSSELGIDDDTILKGLGFKGRNTAKAPKTPKAKDGGTGPNDEPCPICNFKTDPPHDGRSHRGQNKKRPLTAEELEAKGLTKV